jgi:hypothetical protein
VAKSCFGPRLQAAVATLSVRNRVSRHDAVELVQELLGARISSGTMDAFQHTSDHRCAEARDTLPATALQADHSHTYAAKHARNKRCRGIARNPLKA